MSTIQQQISHACNLFTQQVLHIIGSTSLEALCAALSSSEQLTARTAPIRRAQLTPPNKIALPEQTFVDTVARRARLVEMNKVMVTCPVPDCEEHGVRSKKNFCAEHARDLSADVKEQLREAQRTAKNQPAQAG